MILLLNSSNLSRTLPFQRGFFQFWTTNQEQPKSTFAQEKRELERFLLQLMRNQAKSTRTGQLYKKGSTFRWTTLFSITINFFVSPIRVSLFSLTVSPSNQIEKGGWVETFFDQRKRLLFLQVYPSWPFSEWGILLNFFSSMDLERREKHKATFSGRFGSEFLG